MKRRMLLAGGAAGAVAITGGVGILLSAESEDAIISLIRKSFPDLDMAEGELLEFASIARGRIEERSHSAVWSTLVRHKTARRVLDGLSDRDLERLPSLIVTDFIRSTDYLDPDRGSRPTRLVNYADPYRVGCANPLPTYADAGLAWP